MTAFREHLRVGLIALGFGLGAAVQPLMAQSDIANDTAVVVEDRFATTLVEMLALAGQDGIADWYATRGHEPLWSNDPARLEALIAALQGAAENGLPVVRYDPAALTALGQGASDEVGRALLESEAAMTYVRFATDLTSGLLEPSSLGDMIAVRVQRPEVSDLLDRAAESVVSAEFFQTFEPVDPTYAALKVELARLTELVAQGGWGPSVPEGATLRPGNRADRVMAMRVRLDALGYDAGDLESTAFDADLFEVVKQFQADSGLGADGIVGPQTLLALNADPSTHLAQVLVNLERQRWLNIDRGDRHIFVNLASFTVWLIDNGEVTLETRAVIGRPAEKWQTPEFSHSMSYLVANPSWHVPESIIADSYLPRIQNDPSILARQNFVMRVRGTGQPIDPRLLDMSQISARNIVLTQRPGANNALGQVKFMFPNRFNVYLHDTPEQHLMGRDVRAYSAGCVRLQKPLELAHLLLAPQQADPEGYFSSVLRSRQETRIDLETPVPIHLTYQTVQLNEAGDLEFRIDIYGRDTLVFDALQDAGVTTPRVDG